MKLIKEFVADEKIEQNFLISNVTRGITTKGSSYYNVVLQDSSGTIDAKKWEINEGDELIFQPGNIVKVSGDVLNYRGSLQVRIGGGKLVEDKDIDPTHFVKSAPIKKSELEKEFFDYIRAIEDEDVRAIVEEVIKDNFISFSIYPAASKNHHDYASGLMHHTVSMLRLAKAMVELYPGLDKDYLYAGVILHDVGKTIELSGPIVARYTTPGKLLGHISITQAQIKQAADRLGIGGEIPVILQHLVLSHHGKMEFGSPVPPLTKEAEILSFIDNIDSRMNTIDKALEDVKEGEFTNRIFALEDRTFYKPLKNKGKFNENKDN